MLALDRARLAVESSPRNGGPERVSLEDAGWRALWGYQLARNVLSARGLADSVKRELAAFLNSLLGLDPDLRPGKKPAPSARTAISIALYRNRKPSKRS